MKISPIEIYGLVLPVIALIIVVGFIMYRKYRDRDDRVDDRLTPEEELIVKSARLESPKSFEGWDDREVLSYMNAWVTNGVNELERSLNK